MLRCSRSPAARLQLAGSSNGMILASGAGGPGLHSRNSPLLLRTEAANTLCRDASVPKAKKTIGARFLHFPLLCLHAQNLPACDGVRPSTSCFTPGCCMTRRIANHHESWGWCFWSMWYCSFWQPLLKVLQLCAQMRPATCKGQPMRAANSMRSTSASGGALRSNAPMFFAHGLPQLCWFGREPAGRNVKSLGLPGAHFGAHGGAGGTTWVRHFRDATRARREGGRWSCGRGLHTARREGQAHCS